MMTRNSAHSGQERNTMDVVMIIVKILIVVIIMLWYVTVKQKDANVREKTEKAAALTENITALMNQKDYESAYELLKTAEPGTTYDEQFRAMAASCDAKLFEMFEVLAA